MKDLSTFLPAVILLLASIHLSGQERFNSPATIRISTYDSTMLSQLPELTLPSEAARRLIPPVVDNSLLPWFRPIFEQEASSCGQASSIGYAFTYEINTLRNLPANDPVNQYTPYFAYNFLNGGSDGTGVSSYETYEILKQAGCPTVSDYEGMYYGGVTRWMNGYDLYYNAMHNRVSGVYKIKVNTTEGIQTLKNWLYDHGNGSADGGVATFYATNSFINFFPSGVPEAGKNVVSWWDNYANHSLTIVGYNDSIRWDYNGDGLYTNNIDLNNDGIIDPRDYEIGGFKFSNSYGDDWADQGFSYLMTKSLADDYGYGGIWSNTVVVIDVRENYEPQLTAKVSLSYACRNKLRIMAGVSSNSSSTEPDYIQHFPVFNFQGGCHAMQGEGAPETIEIGLDLNPLLNHIEAGQPAKFFLLIQENDPGSEFQGTINSFSIIDYTNGINEINSNISALPIANNTTTSIAINASVNYEDIQIITDTLPEIELNSDFSFSLQAQGGTTPYRWHIAENYSVYDSTASMQLIDSMKLELTSAYTGRSHVLLPFTFPFYGIEYDKVYATIDGYLIFEDSEIPWPYYIDGRTYFIETPMIAAVSCSPLIITNSSQGIWYEEGDGFVIFRWSAQSFGSPNVFNATIKLYSTGRIEINYGDECSFPYWVERFAGISNGDGENYHLLSTGAYFTPEPDQIYIFHPDEDHTGVSISKEGILTAECHQPLTTSSITVCASDQNNIRDFTSFSISTTGLQIEYEILSNENIRIDYGEEVNMNITLTNHYDFPLQEITLNLTTEDPFFSTVTNINPIESLQPGESIQLINAFTIQALYNIPDLHEATITVLADSEERNWHRSFKVVGVRPVLKVKRTTFNDGNNGMAEPGETFELQINVWNKGGSSVQNASATIESTDPYLSILTATANVGLIASSDSTTMIFQVALSPQVPIGHIANIDLHITGDQEYAFDHVIPVHAGIAVESFESADLSILGWQNDTEHPWYFVKDNAFEGNYCLRSAELDYNETSTLMINWNVLVRDSISFWVKTISAGDNKLRFDIRGIIKHYWGGTEPWKRAAFVVNPGNTYFRWKFYKGDVPTYSEDCAWLDYIVFPPLDGSISIKDVAENHARLSIYPNPSSDYLTIQYSLTETGPVSLRVYDNNGKCIFEEREKTLIPGDYTLKPNLGALSPGFYTIQLITTKGSISRKMSKF